MSEHTGWFGSKKKIQETQKEQLREQRKQLNREKLRQHVIAVSADPRFKVRTFDDLNWINPYTGKIISCPFDMEKTVHDFLMRNQPWKQDKEPLPVAKLTQIAWIHFLMKSISGEKRLHIIKGDNWLNPYSGQWIPEVPLSSNGRMDGTTIQYISKFLNGCARSASREFLASRQLDAIAAGIPFEEASEEEAQIDIYDGIIEEDESLYLNLDKVAEESPHSNNINSVNSINSIDSMNSIHSHSPSQPEVQSLTPTHNASDTNTFAAHSVLNDPPISGSSIIPPDVPALPNIDICLQCTDGNISSQDAHSHALIDFITLPNGQTFIIVGDIMSTSSLAPPLAKIKSMLRRVCQGAHTLEDIFTQFNLQLQQQYARSLTISCSAAIVDSLDRHLDVCVINQNPILAARLETGSLLNLVGNSTVAIGQTDPNNYSDHIDVVHITAEDNDVFLLYNNNCCTGNTHGQLYGDFVCALAQQDCVDAQQIVKHIITTRSTHNDACVVAIHFQDEGGL